MEQPKSSPAAAGSLQRALRTPEVLFIGLNCVVGGGIFLLPGSVAASAGPLAVWAILLAGLVITLVALAFAEAGSMFGRTGGPLVYAQEGLGRAAGFSVGWIVWWSYVVGWAALSNAFMAYLTRLVPGAGPYHALGVIVMVALLCAANSYGVRQGATLITVLTVAKLAPLLTLIIVAFTRAPGVATAPAAAPAGGGLWTAVLVLVFAYAGFETAAIPGGEMKNPRRSVVIAIVGTLVSVTLLYTLIQVAALRLDPDIARSTSALADAGARMFNGGDKFMTVGALLSIAGTLAGLALATPRALYALTTEKYLNNSFAALNRRGAPANAIWFTGVIAAVLAVTGSVSQLVLLMVAGILYQYFLVCASVINMRLRRPKLERPFKLPFGVAIPGVAALACAFLLTQQGQDTLVLTAAAILIGFIVYYVAPRIQAATATD